LTKKMMKMNMMNCI